MDECTFFGHRDCSDSIRPLLAKQIENLIEHHNVRFFYVGYKGRFDAMVRGILRDLAIVYPHIHYGVVVTFAQWYKNKEMPRRAENHLPYAYSLYRFRKFPPAFLIRPLRGHLPPGGRHCACGAKKFGFFGKFAFTFG